MAENLNEIINKSVGEIDKSQGGNIPDTADKTQSDKKEESATSENSKPSDESDESNKIQSDLSEDEIRNAKELFKGLKDPNQAPLLIDVLARQAGYVKAPETQKEAREEAKDIVARLKESAGPELEFLIDKIGPTIKSYLEEQVDSVKTEINNLSVSRENDKLVNETTQAINALAQKYYGENEFPKDIYSDMSKMMERLQPSPNMNPKEYIESLYFTVAGKRGIDINNKTKSSERIDKNRNDVRSNLQNNKQAKAQPVAEPAKRLSLKDAVNQAIERVEKGD